MKATDILMEEHQLIERLLNTLEAAAQRLEQKLTIRPELFLAAADFNFNFTGGCHHLKEEKALFRMLVAHGMPERTGPLVMMMHEHARGRAYSELLRQLVRRWQAGEGTARSAIVATVYEYVGLERAHIHQEYHILFPLAEQVIPPETQDQVVAMFEQIERETIGAGTYQFYRSTVAALEREAWAGQ